MGLGWVITGQACIHHFNDELMTMHRYPPLQLRGLAYVESAGIIEWCLAVGNKLSLDH